MGVGDGAFELVLRPRVPMSYFEGAPYVCTLGVVDALRASGVCGVRVAWPHDVVSEQGLLAEVRVRAGYDDGGMYARCSIDIDGGEAIAAEVRRAVEARVAAWEKDVAAGRAAAGPLAPVLDEYFDLLTEEDKALGLDVWGRR